jgi:hypothetical protein
MDTKRTTKLLRLLSEDWEIIRRLKEHYGIASDNEVIRMALRSALRELPSSTAPNKEVALPPPHSSWGLPCALTCVLLQSLLDFCYTAVVHMKRPIVLSFCDGVGFPFMLSV